jgi:Zn-dependent peptidase ImmA (M78 family)
VEFGEIASGVGYGRLAVEAEHDARELLEKAWLQDWSSLRLPVDPFAIARKLGIQVYTDYDLAADVSGMLRKRAGYEDPEILLNARDSRNRQRFTCAHELGHYTQRVKTGQDDAWEYVDRRDPLSAQGMRPDEVYANKFAAELLMPQDAVRSRAGDSNAAALALDFGVSGDAMRFRLENLNLV